MVEYTIASPLKLLVVTITGLLWFCFNMEETEKIIITLIITFLMVIWLTCLWSLYKLYVVLLVLMIVHVVVIILSNSLYIHTPFNKTWVFMLMLLLLVKWYVKELTSLQSIIILIMMFYKELNPFTIVFEGNNQWKCQHNMLWFEGCSSTLFMVYITELLQYFVTPKYPNEITW